MREAMDGQCPRASRLTDYTMRIARVICKADFEAQWKQKTMSLRNGLNGKDADFVLGILSGMIITFLDSPRVTGDIRHKAAAEIDRLMTELEGSIH